MKKIMAILGSIGVIYAAGYAGSSTHALARDHFQGSVLESVAATFSITDHNIAQKNANDNVKSIIEAMEADLKETGSQEGKMLLERLKRQWELDHKRLNRAVKTRQQMIARMSKRQNVTMR